MELNESMIHIISQGTGAEDIHLRVAYSPWLFPSF